MSCLECHHEYHAVDAATPKEDSVPDIVYDPDALAGLDHGALPWAAPVHLCLLVLFLVRLVAVIRWARDADGGRDDNGGGGGGWGPGGPETPPPPSPPSGLLLRQVIPAPRPLARTRLGSSRADVHPPAVRLVAKTGFVPPTGVLWTTDIDGGQALAELEGRACHGHEQLIGAATHGDVSASPTVCHEG
ncbi:MAG: thymidylate synthase [Pseudonocardiales bacterium]|nr:thymidylate synthase [Pseudonocardiales bacterium]